MYKRPINENMILRNGAAELYPDANEMLQIICVTNNPENIKNFINPSEDVQKAAIRLNPYVIRFIKRPTESAKKLADDLIRGL